MILLVRGSNMQSAWDFPRSSKQARRMAGCPALLKAGRQAGYKFSPILASVQIWGRGGCVWEESAGGKSI